MESRYLVIKFLIWFFSWVSVDVSISSVVCSYVVVSDRCSEYIFSM